MTTVSDVQVTGLDLNGMAREFSKTQGGKGATLVLSYPKVDERNHKSLDALTAAISGHGMAGVAAQLHDELEFLVIQDAVAALKVYREIQRDSLAIGVSLFFDGHSGSVAEQRIESRIPHAHDGLAAQHARVHGLGHVHAHG